MAASDNSFGEEFAISCVGTRQRPTPRSTGRCFNSEGMTSSVNEGNLGFGCDPASRVAWRAIERCNPTSLATSKTAVMIDELVL